MGTRCSTGSRARVISSPGAPREGSSSGRCSSLTGLRASDAPAVSQPLRVARAARVRRPSRIGVGDGLSATARRRRDEEERDGPVGHDANLPAERRQCVQVGTSSDEPPEEPTNGASARCPCSDRAWRPVRACGSRRVLGPERCPACGPARQGAGWQVGGSRRPACACFCMRRAVAHSVDTSGSSLRPGASDLRRDPSRPAEGRAAGGRGRPHARRPDGSVRAHSTVPSEIPHLSLQRRAWSRRGSRTPCRSNCAYSPSSARISERIRGASSTSTSAAGHVRGASGTTGGCVPGEVVSSASASTPA